MLVTGVDTIGVRGARVVLHRIGRADQGPLDSAATGSEGGFRFRFPADSEAVYLLSARHAGIEYFSDPVLPDAAGQARVLVIVADTSSAAPVTLASRFMLAGAPEVDSARIVLDVLVLSNESGKTRVPVDATTPTWALSGLPSVTIRVENGTEFSREAVTVRKDSVLVFAPVSPGRRQLVLGYVLPSGARELSLAVDRALAELTVLGEETTLRVDAPGLREGPHEQVEGRSIRRWVGSAESGDLIRLRFPREGGGSDRLALAALVLLTAAALVGGYFWSRRRVAPAVRTGPPTSPTALLDEMARLDARYDGHEAEVAPGEWAAYLRRRDELKSSLARALEGR